MTLRFKIQKPIEHVFGYLTDMDKFSLAHPVISRIDSKSNNDYLVHETLKFGFIPFTFSYPVAIKENKQDHKVTMDATVMKMINILLEFKLTQENGFTIIEENLSFKSILPVKFLLSKVFRKQHALLFENIESLD